MQTRLYSGTRLKALACGVFFGQCCDSVRLQAARGVASRDVGQATQQIIGEDTLDSKHAQPRTPQPAGSRDHRGGLCHSCKGCLRGRSLNEPSLGVAMLAAGYTCQ